MTKNNLLLSAIVYRSIRGEVLLRSIYIYYKPPNDNIILKIHLKTVKNSNYYF